MNEFTKKELEIIYCNLCVNPKTHDILKKIEVLHQNYCECKNTKMDCDGGISLVCLDCRRTVVDC